MSEGYDAVLLAGGRARRLGGVDKPGLVVGDRPLLAWAADAVGDAGRLVVVGPARPEPARAVVVREDPPGAGPVPALRAGLAEVRARWTAVLAADLPFLRPEHVAALRGAAAGRTGAVLTDDTGYPQWLVGVWRTVALRAALFDYGGSSLRGVLAPLDPETVRLPVSARPAWYDCDTEADLATAARMVRQARRRPGRTGDREGAVPVLEKWIDTACAELGLHPSDVDHDLLLDLARQVAHGVARPAAPLTAYLIGLAVGRGAPARDAAARITALAEDWDGA